MHFNIITPSCNQLDYLKRCVASVRDQLGAISDKQLAGGSGLNANGCQLMAKSSLTVHHHIQDGGSTDGTVDWLRQYDAEIRGRRSEDSEQRQGDGEVREQMTERQQANSQQPIADSYSFSFKSERDRGMYDALNRGIQRILDSQRTDDREQQSDAEKKLIANSSKPLAVHADTVFAWLNCDEQYLPGTLEFVADYFEQHPDTDMLFGDYLIVDKEGKLLSFRKGSRPRLWYIQVSHLNNLSCAMFFRVGVFQDLGGFDTKYKAVADEDFVVRALKMGFKAKRVPYYFSVFTYTGNNLGWGEAGLREFEVLKKEVPFLLKLFTIPLNLFRWIEKWMAGAYYQRFPITYSIYAGENRARKEFISRRVGWKWPTAE